MLRLRRAGVVAVVLAVEVFDELAVLFQQLVDKRVLFLSPSGFGFPLLPRFCQHGLNGFGLLPGSLGLGL